MKVKKIDIGIKGLKESLNDFADTWKKLDAGKKTSKEEGIYFDSIDTMRAVLTNKRLLILRTIRERHPASVYELAKFLKRDIKNVNQDLAMLSASSSPKWNTIYSSRNLTTSGILYLQV